MRNQKRGTKVSQTPVRKFSKTELVHLNNLVSFGKEEFSETPHPVQAECMAYHYWYLDEELDLNRAVQHLQGMETRFLQLSKNQENLNWAVDFYYAHTINRLKVYFQEMQALKLGRMDQHTSHPA